MNSKADFYFTEAEKWQRELEQLRKIILGFPLSEDVKWGVPCYALENGNVVLIHVFKEYCALLFFKGALLKDPKGILVQQTKNTQAARQIRFTTVREILAMKDTLKAYINEAIEVERAGLKVEYKESAEFEVPVEFQDKLETVPGLKAAFDALTPGRQRAYLLHFAAPKQAKTRESRVEKWLGAILNGKGLND